MRQCGDEMIGSPQAAVFLGIWPFTVVLGIAGTTTGLMWRLPWWSALYAVPVTLWCAAGMWWWVRGARAPWQRAVRGFAQAHVAAWVIIEAVSLSGVFGPSLLSQGWSPGAAGIGAIGAFYLLGFATVLLPPLIGPIITFVWALRASRWSRRGERAATVAVTLWTAAAGLLSLTLSA